MSELELLRQSLDVLTADIATARETGEQWRVAYWNEVSRTDKLTTQIILLTTPKAASTVEAATPAPEDDTGLPQNVMRAISARAHLAPRQELIEYAETQLANGESADSVADTILIGAMRSDDTEETGYEGPDEDAGSQ